MKAPKQCRYDMAVRGVIVVARSIHIGRHGRQETRAILAVVAPAALDSGDLSERIGAMCAFQRPGEEIFLLDWLGRQLRIDAALCKKQPAVNARFPCIASGNATV